jgi:hypothetical protein
MGYKMFYRVPNGLGRVYKCLLSYKMITNPKVIKTPLIIPSFSQQNHGKAEGASHRPHLQGEQRRSPRSDRPPSQPRFRNFVPNALPKGQVSLLADTHSGRCLRHRDGRLRSRRIRLHSILPLHSEGTLHLPVGEESVVNGESMALK